MRTALFAALLCAAGLILPCGCREKTEQQKKAEAFVNKAKAEVQEIKDMAEKGNPEAQSRLGFFYRFGLVVKKDAIESVKWYRKAAEQNHAEAQMELGRCYANGEGVTKDLAQCRTAAQRFVTGEVDFPKETRGVCENEFKSF